MAEPAVSGPFETARVEAFSDGIFAIAITLLVLEIKEGRLLEQNADREAVRNISQRYMMGPLVYAISFGLALHQPVGQSVGARPAGGLLCPARPETNRPPSRQVR